MAVSGQFPVADREILVALSVLRLGSDTRAARVFREEVAADLQGGTIGGLEALARLAELAGLPPWSRTSQLAEAQKRAVQALRRADALAFGVLSLFHPAYPALLACIPDPPIVLWTRGSVDLNLPAVALVGSRNASPAGLELARHLGRELGRAGVLVVSGLARGIDAAAHRGALESRGRTVAVLGNGLDVPYPHQHISLAAEIASSGAVITEFPPGTQPFQSHFPLRNRIISGLSRAVVVVEASERSGSLITARAALEQGRDVLAVPGNVAPGHHRGCHALIKDGARLVETVDDILEEIGWSAQAARQARSVYKLNQDNDLEARVAVGEVVTVDDLAERTGRPAAEWLAELTELEIAGKVARTPAGAFIRLDASGTNRKTHGQQEG